MELSPVECGEGETSAWGGRQSCSSQATIFSQTLPILLINSNNNRPHLGVVRARWLAAGKAPSTVPVLFHRGGPNNSLPPHPILAEANWKPHAMNNNRDCWTSEGSWNILESSSRISRSPDLEVTGLKWQSQLSWILCDFRPSALSFSFLKCKMGVFHAYFIWYKDYMNTHLQLQFQDQTEPIKDWCQFPSPLCSTSLTVTPGQVPLLWALVVTHTSFSGKN